MLEVLHRVAVAVGHTHKIEDVIRTAAAEIRLRLGMETAGLYLLDPSSGRLAVNPYEERHYSRRCFRASSQASHRFLETQSPSRKWPRSGLRPLGTRLFGMD